MTRQCDQSPVGPSRRDFLKTSAATGAAISALSTVAVHAAQQVNRTFKVALIGCGGRGRGALANHIEAAEEVNKKLGWNLKIEVIATGDFFENKARSTGQQYNLPEDRCFGGADNYQKVIALKPDIVLLAEPPVFRPQHFEAAINAGCHVFMEKPVAVDPPGVRRIIKSGDVAKGKGLSVIAGTQRRHSQGYNNQARDILGGAFGRVMAGRVAWNMGRIFTNTPINPTGPEHLAGPWTIWVEMSGDHIVEQHVHNIDIANWFLDAHPVSAGGFGLRAQRVAGNMYDFFSVDFEYPGGVHVHSMCRQIADCWNWVGESFTFERSKPADFQTDIPDIWEEVGYPKGDYVAEHAHLLYSIVKEMAFNEARNVAWATAGAILGRESAYSGLRLTWDELFENPTKSPAWYNLTLRPTAEDFLKGEVPLPKDGDIRIPGIYRPEKLG